MSSSRFFLLTLAVILTCCGGGAGTGTGTGVRGVALMGPQCPVENAESPCPDAPFRGEVQATATDGSMRSTTTDDRGRFTLDLAPGTYDVVAVTSSSGPPTAKPQTIDVHEGSYTRVTLEVDTGIR